MGEKKNEKARKTKISLFATQWMLGGLCAQKTFKGIKKKVKISFTKELC